MRNLGFVFLITFWLGQISLAEEIQEQKTAFSSIISLGKMVKANENSISYSHSNSKVNYNLLSSTSSSSVTSKIGDYEYKTTTGVLTYQYGVSDRFSLGVGLLNDFSNTTQFTFTSAAKASGYTDSYNSRSGLRDPIFVASIILKDRYDFRLFLQGSYSPKSAERTKANTVNGGQQGQIELAAIKSFDSLEFGFSFGYLTYGVRTQPSDSGGTVETSGGNTLFARVGLNYFLSTDVSFLLQIERSMTDLSTSRYSSSSTSTDTSSYNLGANYLGLQLALQDDFSFNVKYVQMTSDLVKSTTGSTVLSLDQSSFNGYSLGFNYYF